jgi:4-amino-4-deoxy-L-arabinose transferase-like glycosyltransferase
MSGIICGLTAVLVLFGHEPLMLDHGLRSNNMEAALVLSYCAGMFHAIAWAEARERTRRWTHALLVGFWFAFGFMMKFVAAVFLPAALAAMFVLSNRWRARIIQDWTIWAASCGVALALIAPWFLYQYDLRGHDFWAIIFGQHIFERFTAYLDPSHLHPWYFYFARMWSEFSWSHSAILVCAGLALLAWQAIRERSDRAVLMLVWFVLPLAAISAGTSKLYHYVFPFLPPLALGVGLVPTTVLNAARQRRDQISRAIERIWPSSMSARMPPWLRSTLIVIAVFFVAMAVATPIFGSVWIRVHGMTLFRNSTTSRPLIAATVLLDAAGRFRDVPLALVGVLLLVVLPFDAYRNVRALQAAQAAYDGAPMRTLRDCLLRVQASGAPAGVYVHTADTGQWKYAYYLRDPGWRVDEATDQKKLLARLLTPGEERPVFLQAAEFKSFRASQGSKDAADVSRLDHVARITWDDDWMILLPGPYAPCVDVKGGSVTTSR